MQYEDRFTSINHMFELAKDNKNPSDVVLVCRNVLEKTIDLIFEVQNVRKPVNAQLLELINNDVVQNYLDNDVLIDALHFVRIVGINAYIIELGNKAESDSADNKQSYSDFAIKVLGVNYA